MEPPNDASSNPPEEEEDLVVANFRVNNESTTEESDGQEPEGIKDGESNQQDVAATEDVNALNGFGERQARRMARNPCLHFWVSLLLSIALSVIGLVVGEFSIASNNAGWQSRGTLIANRHTQLMLANEFKEALLYGGEEVWENLLNKVQPGWEDDDDSRRLAFEPIATLPEVSESWVEYLTPRADRIQLGETHKKLPFHLTGDLRRSLQVQANITSGILEGCDVDWYTSSDLTTDTRLWPVWKMAEKTDTALRPQIVHDICEAEQETLALLEQEGLCFGCEEGCLQPYSIVFYARLKVPNGMSLTCSELRDAWAPYQVQTEQEWKTCVEDIKETYTPDSETLPDSCPFGFAPLLVEEFFDESLQTIYTSSIFPTTWNDVDELYEKAGSFDRGSGLVRGAYDTQYEDFVNTYLDASLGNDMALAMGSAVVVAIALVIHTRSPFISVIGLVQIMLSFPLSYFVYKLVAGLDFFPFLNFLGIFIVFALGAGDVFVAVDKWKNARLDLPLASTEYIAAVALPDAASAMFLTTLTTAVAFFATAICPVAPIKMFAIFCGLLVIFDYIMNVLLVFPALCIYDSRIQLNGPSKVSCFITCGCFGLFSASRDTEEHDEEAIDDSGGAKERKEGDSSEKKVLEPSFIRRVLLGFYRILHLIRWPLFAFCVAVLGVCAYYATTLELPTSSDVRLLDEDHQYEQNYLWRQKLLSTILEKAGGSPAFVIWGVKPADTGNHNDPAEWSQLVLDDTFEPSSTAAQVHLRDYCGSFFQEDFAAPVDDDYICPMKRFDEWLGTQSSANEQDSTYTDNCAGATGVPVAEGSFDSCITAWAQSVGETYILSRSGKVEIMFFPFTSRVRFDDPYDNLDSEWKAIEAFTKRQNMAAPVGAGQAFFTSYSFWWYDTNGKMLTAAYSAAGIALGCAAVVILFSSRSVVLTLFSTLTIGYVLTSVTASLAALGWTLGFLESVCLAILIGVSVDFVIHFSHAYSSLKGNVDRGQRTKYALVKMGPSILATAITTIFAAVVMLFTVYTFFQKFALILFFTVIQASAGSFIVFLVMADCFGPSNPTYLVDKLCGRKPSSDPNEFTSSQFLVL